MILKYKNKSINLTDATRFDIYSNSYNYTLRITNKVLVKKRRKYRPVDRKYDIDFDTKKSLQVFLNALKKFKGVINSDIVIPL